jgi:hypothetical protein
MYIFQSPLTGKGTQMGKKNFIYKIEKQISVLNVIFYSRILQISLEVAGKPIL